MSLDDVAAFFGVPVGALAETVARHNEDVATGEDSEFHNDPSQLFAIEPPY